MDEYIRRTVHAALTHTMYATGVASKSEKARNIYQILFDNLCCKDKNPPYYIEGARKRFFLDISEIIAFIDFFINHSSSDVAKKAIEKTSEDVGILIKYKESMTNYINKILVECLAKVIA